MRLLRLSDLVNIPLSNDNLHRIAISNLSDNERIIQRWWCKKYKKPLKPYEEHTIEELVIEMLEDYYDAHPQEVALFETKTIKDDWDGRMSDEYEKNIQKRLGKIKKVDDSRFKSDRELTPEQERQILENLGKDLPGSKIVKDQTKETLGSGEFEEIFE